MNRLLRCSAIFLLILMLLNFPLIAKAHPGRTDSNGGHTNSSTGEYHYHHGYEAHSHYDMDGDGIRDCPYDFKDNKSQKTSNNSISSKTTNNTASGKGTSLAVNTIFWGSIFVIAMVKESNDRKR